MSKTGGKSRRDFKGYLFLTGILLLLAAGSGAVYAGRPDTDEKAVRQRDGKTEPEQSAAGDLEAETEQSAAGDPVPEVERQQEDLWNIGILQPLEGEDPDRAGELAARCVVRLDVTGEDGEFYGSGVLWDRDGDDLILATAGHLLEKGEKLRVFFPGGETGEGSDAAVSAATDIGFIRVSPDLSVPSGTFFPSLEKGPLPSLVSLHQRMFDTLDDRSPLLVVASTRNGAGDLIRGTCLYEKGRYLDEFGTDVMLLDCRGWEGMSGGGVFDGCANLTGLVVGGNASGLAVLSMEKINDACEELYGYRRDTKPYEQDTVYEYDRGK